jgi:hypothetical protein
MPRGKLREGRLDRFIDFDRALFPEARLGRANRGARDAPAAMPEPFAGDLRMDAGFQGVRSVRMPQVVETDPHHSRTCDEAWKALQTFLILHGFVTFENFKKRGATTSIATLSLNRCSARTTQRFSALLKC